jgi:two-component system, response regulator PdtaR
MPLTPYFPLSIRERRRQSERLSIRWAVQAQLAVGNFVLVGTFALMTPRLKPANSPVVLVVEDEPLLRQMTVQAFDDAGLVVLEADNAGQALAILNANADFIDVLFTDIAMPEAINGMLLAAQTKERWPWVGIMMTSGKVAPSPGALPPKALFVAKPYEAERVVAAIREITQASTSTNQAIR